MQNEEYMVWVPNDFPACKSDSGSRRDSKDSPLAWVVWSLGPRQSYDKALLNELSPVSGKTWYRGTGDNGVIARIHPRYGASFQTP
jgi:hypothetical protein